MVRDPHVLLPDDFGTDPVMAFALHRWTRETLLARLEASEAIDAAAEVDETAAARDRLRLLGLGDRLEAHVLTDVEAIEEFHRLRDEARSVAREHVRAE